MKNNDVKYLAAGLLLTAGLTVSCTRGGRDASQEIVRPLGDSEVILEFKGGKISAGDVNERMKPLLERSREFLAKEYVRTAEQMLAERKQKADAPEVEVSDFELGSYMKANRIPETEKSKIHSFLLEEKKRLAREDEKRNLFESLQVKNKLGTAQFRVQENKNAPAMGGGKAQVTVQVFCDFANPLCNRARLAMQAGKTEFGDKVRWVYRYFPVASNAGSFAAASLAICAQEQDLFWPAHDRLLDNAPAVAKEDFTKVIAAIPGLDAKKLGTCMQSQEAKTKLNAEVKEGMDLGITSTPVYFVGNAKVEDVEKIESTIKSQLNL